MAYGGAVTLPDLIRGPARRGAAVWVVVGVLGAVLTAAALTTVLALTDRPLGTSDEIAHLDYAVQVSDGELPDFYEGVQFRPPVAGIPPVQWVAQHPPLYYLLAAPAVASAADRGDWVEATMLGRAVSVCLGAAAVVAVAWAAAGVVPRRRGYVAVGCAVVVACLGPFQLVAAAVYTDVLAVLLTALALGVSVRLLRRGPSAGRLLAAAGLASALLATRAMSLPVVVVLVLGVAAAELLHGARGPVRDLGVGVLRGGLVAAVAVATNAWFYLRNVASFGTWTGGDPDWAAENLGARRYSYGEVALDPQFWIVYARFLVPRSPDLDLSLAVTGVGVVLALVAARRLVRRMRAEGLSAVDGAILLLLVLLVLSTVAVQVQHRTSGGGAQWRYVLPVLLPVALVVVHGSEVRGWPRGAGLVAAAGCLVGLSPGVAALVSGLSGDGAPLLVPRGVLVLLAVLLVAGVAAWVAGLLRLAGQDVADGRSQAPSLAPTSAPAR